MQIPPCSRANYQRCSLKNNPEEGKKNSLSDTNALSPGGLETKEGSSPKWKLEESTGVDGQLRKV